ncbi:DENN domain-containing protein 1A [Oncorhynchus kisutch]|uniref:DENN domain-containing protein 1A n=1 Tax=Oncorhynchus kisutch TaxID=8019 RepID=UPI0012DCF77C|nr:DENN domain-containing protein 1A-like [Oncorhynchus kisutch]
MRIKEVKSHARMGIKEVKSHARMGIKEVKSRLKQKELAENGYSSTADTGGTGAAHHSALWTGSDNNYHQWLFTVKARPSRLLVAKRPRSNVGLESSPEQPQPYHSLKEAEFAEEPSSGPSYTAPPSPATEKFADINLLGDMFSCLDETRGPAAQPCQEPGGPPHSQRPPGAAEIHLPDSRVHVALGGYRPGSNIYFRRMDLSGSEHTCTLPGLKHPCTLPGLKDPNPYNKMWSVHGQDHMAVASRLSPNWDGPLSVPPPELEEPLHPSRESFGPGVSELPDPSTTPSQGGCITIPAPRGGKPQSQGRSWLRHQCTSHKTSQEWRGRVGPPRQGVRSSGRPLGWGVT